MNEIRISVRGGRENFRPGEVVEGSASWNLTAPPGAVEIRLVWYTRGKGTPDVSIVESSRAASPPAMGDAPFRFVLPEGPHSFSGRLISLLWAVEVVALPAGRGRELASARREFVLAPEGREIVLEAVEKPLTPAQVQFRQRKEEFQRRRMR